MSALLSSQSLTYARLLLERHNGDLHQLAMRHVGITDAHTLCASVERILLQLPQLTHDQRGALAPLLRRITADLSTAYLDTGLIVGLAARPALTRRRG